MKKFLIHFLLLIAVFLLPLGSVDAAVTDASKWSPCFTGERAYKTPKQSVTAVKDGIKFTGVGGERENYTYSYSEPIKFPAEDLTFEFTINEGTEPEMLFAFAFMDKPNWGSWYSNNDCSGLIINVRINDSVDFHMAPALDWPTHVEFPWPEYDAKNISPAIATKDKKMKFQIKKSAKGYKLFVNGIEVPEFEAKSDQFFLKDVLPQGKAYLSVSGLNYTFDPELVSTMTLHSITTTPSTIKTSGGSSASNSGSTGNTSGPKIDNGDEDESTIASAVSENSATGTIGAESTVSTESTDSSNEISTATSGASSTTSTDAPKKDAPSSTTWIIVAVCAVVVLAGASACYYFFIYKKKNK